MDSKHLTTVVAGAIVIVFVIIGVMVLAVTGDQISATAKILIINSLITTVIGGTLPALMAHSRIQSVQHDIHNGVVQEKIREGTKEAIVEIAEDPSIDAVAILKTEV